MKKSLYARYIKEREGFDTIEDERGFATYFISGEECYIRDIYILPEFRRQKVAFEFAEKISNIAKEGGAKVLTGTVFPKTFGSSDSMQALLWYGFKLHFSTHEKIVLIKEI